MKYRLALNLLEQRNTVPLGIQHFVIEEWKRDFVPGREHNLVNVFLATVLEGDSESAELGDNSLTVYLRHYQNPIYGCSSFVRPSRRWRRRPTGRGVLVVDSMRLKRDFTRCGIQRALPTSSISTSGSKGLRR